VPRFNQGLALYVRGAGIAFTFIVEREQFNHRRDILPVLALALGVLAGVDYLVTDLSMKPSQDA
jgi:hypothetical protein